MKLQILVPQYKETNEEVRPLLKSIALQQSVDFSEIGVIICNDGSDVYLTDEVLTGWPFKVEYYKEKHSGVSATRNACLDHATADYVMFCDADDMFYNMCGLWIIFREMEVGFDSLVSCFTEETRFRPTIDANGNKIENTSDDEKSEITYVTHQMDSTFVHGKIHRRQYLLDKKIRFKDSLTIHEDSYFNILCQNLSENVKYCQTPFYLWKWRDESVCRHDPKYILKTYRNMLDSNDALVDEFIKRGKEDKAKFYCVFMVFDAYYNMNKPEWIDQENQEYRNLTENRFSTYFKKHKHLWDSVSMQDRTIISDGVRKRTIGEGMLMEAITIYDWLDHIQSLS